MRKSLVAVLAGAALLITGTPALAQTTTGRPTLGPYGYGTIKLGMSAKKAKATGKIVLKRPAGAESCSGWGFTAHPTKKNSVSLYISKKLGVAVIFAPKGVKTPRGIGIGSTMKQVRKAYPRLKMSPGGIPYVSVPGNSKAYYSFFPETDGKLVGLALKIDYQDCVS
ncbi:hypothetical protein ACTMTI_20030 [Nonomuraea sp. H19]|uniref:hypothetical protein n=1 Tax=Nonomuraea sp. H19 TaxID=3452206 RepID=UPI003F8BD766